MHINVTLSGIFGFSFIKNIKHYKEGSEIPGEIFIKEIEGSQQFCSELRKAASKFQTNAALFKFFLQSHTSKTSTNILLLQVPELTWGVEIPPCHYWLNIIGFTVCLDSLMSLLCQKRTDFPLKQICCPIKTLSTTYKNRSPNIHVNFQSLTVVQVFGASVLT